MLLGLKNVGYKCNRGYDDAGFILTGAIKGGGYYLGQEKWQYHG